SSPTHLGKVGNQAYHGVFAAGNYAYTTSSNNIDILDISDPSSPTRIVQFLDTGSTRLRGGSGIFGVGNYVYVAANSDDAVAVVDISDPANPSYMGHLADDGSTELDGAMDIYVVGDYAYVAAEKDDGVEIADVSDPTNITHVGAISDTAETALNGAYGIFVAGKYAYVAASGDDGVAILDVSDPENPIHVASIFDDDTMALDGARNIVVVGDYAYVTGHDEDGIAMLDVSDPSNPVHVASIYDDDSMALEDPHGIAASGQYLYVTGRDFAGGNSGVTVFDISGVTAPAATLGSVATGILQVNGPAQLDQNLTVEGGLNVGSEAMIRGDLSVQGTLFAPLNVTSLTGGKTLEPIHTGVVLVDNAATLTITLPDAADAIGLIFTIKNINTTGTVTVATAGGNIDGATTQSLAAQFDFITVISDGTNWYIINQ
ncbi:MAG: hypothetical protein HN416_14255, partial [Nitrospina sp.]|nr:hypothetical protein [Nitrospina sp.]